MDSIDIQAEVFIVVLDCFTAFLQANASHNLVVLPSTWVNCRFSANLSLAKTMNYVWTHSLVKCMSNLLISSGFIIYNIIQYNTW